MLYVDTVTTTWTWILETKVMYLERVESPKIPNILLHHWTESQQQEWKTNK